MRYSRKNVFNVMHYPDEWFKHVHLKSEQNVNPTSVVRVLDFSVSFSQYCCCTITVAHMMQ